MANFNSLLNINENTDMNSPANMSSPPSMNNRSDMNHYHRSLRAQHCRQMNWVDFNHVSNGEQEVFHPLPSGVEYRPFYGFSNHYLPQGFVSQATAQRQGAGPQFGTGWFNNPDQPPYIAPQASPRTYHFLSPYSSEQRGGQPGSSSNMQYNTPETSHLPSPYSSEQRDGQPGSSSNMQYNAPETLHLSSPYSPAQSTGQPGSSSNMQYNSPGTSHLSSPYSSRQNSRQPGTSPDMQYNSADLHSSQPGMANSGSGPHPQESRTPMNQNHGEQDGHHLGQPPVVYNLINVTGGHNNFQGNPMAVFNQQPGSDDVSSSVNNTDTMNPDPASIEMEQDDPEEGEDLGNNGIVARTKDGTYIVRRAKACESCRKNKTSCKDVNGPHSACARCVHKGIPCTDKDKGGREFVRGDQHREAQAQKQRFKAQQQQVENLIRENRALKDEVKNLKEIVNNQTQTGNVQFGSSLHARAPSISNWHFESATSAPAAGSMNSFGEKNHQNIQQPDQQPQEKEETAYEEE